ncbi:potential sterol binding protein [Pseudozyma hubeiensis SY62]|uniref:Potential sterol binding protein n=1 Tax=Pseudozyma hubeiensis (strain SY62) TaxID=1305764 RepID=R9P874_PSEHS|nr:potential sterol binding protein [Pseudozyma hubeiensis SY62]GAC97598.1 potential sterol binding protein [Pseudozyma hubeiensis SY62]
MMEPTTKPTHPPKDDPISVEDLKQYDGTDESKPVYVAVKGTVFDVSPKREMYAPGKGYHIFAGKDGSRGLGMSSLKPEDAVPDYSTLDDKQLKVLDDWHSYYTKRYNIVGKVKQS